MGGDLHVAHRAMTESHRVARASRDDGDEDPVPELGHGDVVGRVRVVGRVPDLGRELDLQVRHVAQPVERALPDAAPVPVVDHDDRRAPQEAGEVRDRFVLRRVLVVAVVQVHVDRRQAGDAEAVLVQQLEVAVGLQVLGHVVQERVARAVELRPVVDDRRTARTAAPATSRTA